MNNVAVDRRIIYFASFLRSLSIGMIAVLLAIFLMKAGFSKPEVGIVVSIGLFGAALGNLFVTFFGDCIGRRKTLVMISVLTAMGAVSVCLTSNFYAILITAFFGMLNARGKDRGAALVIETAIMPTLESNQNRTRSFAWYSLFQEMGLAIGGICAGIPTILATHFAFPELAAFKIGFAICGAATLISGLLYCYLSKDTEVTLEKIKFGFSPEGKKVITKISALFGLDSLAGGFLTSTLIAYYFYERFNISVEALGLLFFAARCLNGLSYFASVWLSKRIGLINTMVFTHSPSHLFLIAIAFAPSFPIAVIFYLLREALVEMDVPTKKSYLMAVIKPEERTQASGITQMVRMLGCAVAPAFAGSIMQYSLSSPLFIGASIKLAYDLLIYLSFKRISPPEESKQVLVA